MNAPTDHRDPNDTDHSSPECPYRTHVRHAEQLLRKVDTEPEDIVQAMAHLRTAYEQLCAKDPVFRAEENQSDDSQFKILQHQMMEKLKAFAKIKPNLYRMYRRLSTYPNLYPKSPSTPGDVTMQPTTPQPQCEPELQRWQPFASDAPPLESESSISRKSVMKPTRVARPGSRLQLTPMEVDQDDWLPTISQPMQSVTKASQTGGNSDGGLSLMGQLARLLRVSGSKAQPKKTPKGAPPVAGPQRPQHPAIVVPRKTLSRRPFKMHRTAATNKRSQSVQTLETSEEGSVTSCNTATTASQTSTGKNTREEPLLKSPLKVNTKKNLESSHAQDSSKPFSADDPPVVQHCDSNHQKEPYQPFWRLRISPKDPKVPIQTADALDFALREAPRTVRHHLAVSELSLYVYVKPWTKPLTFLERLNQAEMDELRQQIEEMRQGMNAQASNVESQGRRLDEYARRHADQQEQINDRDRIIRELRQELNRNQRQNQPPTGEGDAAPSQESPPTGPSQSEPPQSTAPNGGTTSNGAGQSRTANQTETAGAEAGTSVPPGLEAFAAFFQSQMNELRRDMTAQIREAGHDAGAPQSRLAARVLQQEESSRNMRELLEGLDKDEMLRRHPEGGGRDVSNLRGIERNMRSVVLREEEHRNTLPKPGDGAHYLKGDPPFWRQPWPPNWQVPKPWEFAENYDQKEMQQILKNPDLTEFSGNKQDYAQWQRMFHQAVHVQDIDVNRKYNLLLKYISPTVKSNITGGLGRSTNDYCFAVVRLERNYGLGTQRPETEVESITTFRPLSDRDLSRANDFMHRLESYLSRTPVDAVVATQTVMPAIKRILPNPWLDRYYSWIEDHGAAANPHTVLNFLRPFLRNKADLLPYLKPTPDPANRRPPPAVKPRPLPIRGPTYDPPKGAALIGLDPHNNPVCDCCSQAHSLKAVQTIPPGTD